MTFLQKIKLKDQWREVTEIMNRRVSNKVVNSPNISYALELKIFLFKESINIILKYIWKIKRLGVAKPVMKTKNDAK